MIKRILALDISLSSTGFTILDVNTETSECRIVRIGSTATTKIKSRGNKLSLIFAQMKYLEEEYNPDVVIAEQPFSRHNTSTQAIFGAVGVIQMAFSKYDFIWYPPSTVKKVITGNGKADKETVAEVMKSLFEKVSFANDDESDSLAVAITHVEQSEEFQNVS